MQEYLEVGQIVNVAKTEATEIIGTKEEEINTAILNEKLAKEIGDLMKKGLKDIKDKEEKKKKK